MINKHDKNMIPTTLAPLTFSIPFNLVFGNIR
jgi:hypothetical protein